MQRLAAELDKRGTVDVLRRGVVDRNITIRLAYFRPAHGLTPELAARYDANVLSVTRQLPFDPASGRTIDLGLFVNVLAGNLDQFIRAWAAHSSSGG